MYTRLKNIVDWVVQYESLIEVYDENVAKFYSLTYKKDLIKGFALSDELLNLVNDLADNAQNYKNMLRAAEARALDETGMSIEELRMNLVKLRTTLNTIMSNIADNTKDILKTKTSPEEMLSYAEQLLQSPEEG